MATSVSQYHSLSAKLQSSITENEALCFLSSVNIFQNEDQWNTFNANGIIANSDVKNSIYLKNALQQMIQTVETVKLEIMFSADKNNVTEQVTHQLQLQFLHTTHETKSQTQISPYLNIMTQFISGLIFNTTSCIHSAVSSKPIFTMKLENNMDIMQMSKCYIDIQETQNYLNNLDDIRFSGGMICVKEYKNKTISLLTLKRNQFYDTASRLITLELQNIQIYCNDVIIH